MMRVIHPEGHTDIREGKVTLAEVQEAVGGFIETVPYFLSYMEERCQAYCDEEGKLKGYPINMIATTTWHGFLNRRKMATDDVLVGNVVILTGESMLK